MKDTGIVNIHGKEYQTVALRVHLFRERCPTWSLITEVLHRDSQCVVMKASILDAAGRVWATGHAEEYRADGKINKTSALENAETSAIGRALACLGMGGTEFASADEVARAVSGDKPAAPTGPISPTRVIFEGLQPEQQQYLRRVAFKVSQALTIEDKMDLIAAEDLDEDHKSGLWHLLDSQTRSALKAAKEAA